MLLLSLLACNDAPVHALVLTGWEYEWEQLSHRVSLLKVALNQDGTADLGLIGGSYTTGQDATDTPYYRLGYADIGIPGAVYTEGSAEWTIGPDPSGTTTITATAPDGCDHDVAVYLDGFSINTDVAQSSDYPVDYDPGLGYTSNGFGFTLGEPYVVRRDQHDSGGDLSVEVTASVRWAPQDRDDMNAAIPFAQTGVSATVLFVCFKGEIVASPASSGTDYPWEPPYTDQPPMTADVSIAGKKPEGVLAFSGFELTADFTNVDGSAAGDYLRSFGVEVDGSDDGAGAWSGTSTAQITNSSLIEYGDLNASFTADYSRIGVKGAVSEARSAAGTHEVGETTISLD